MSLNQKTQMMGGVMSIVAMAFTLRTLEVMMSNILI